jgi:hypothetical protein
MITMTFTWWGFTLYFAALGVFGYIGGRVGGRLGRALYRRVQRRKAQRAQRDTIEVQ